MHVSLTASVTAAVLLVMTAAAAGDCEPRARVEVDVAPTPFEPGLSKLVAAQLLHEAADDPDQACTGTARLIRIEVTWPDADHADVHVEVRRGNAGRTAVRTVDLTKIPTDGRALAISIAATELADETEETARMTPPKPKPEPSPVVAARPRAPLAERDHLGAFGPRLAFDAFSDGPALIGPDACTSFVIAPRIDAAFRFGVRAPLNIARAGSSYVFGASIAVSARPATHPWGVSGQLRVDAISLASPDSHNTVLVPAIGGAAWVRAGSIARLTFDAAIGAPIRTEGTAARGVVVSGALGVAVSF